MSICYRPAEQNSDSCSWPLGCFWSVCFFIVAVISYFLYRPLHLPDKFKHMSMFLNTLSPKFYVALTGTSSLISGLILIFEWWYFRKYGKSFIEQISLTHIYPLIGGADDDNDCESVDSNGPVTTTQECKVWRNPYSLFRGAEYQRFFRETGRDPLTYYDMNLSAQDHQTFFTCEADAGRPEYELMQMAWRERNHEERIKKTKEALAKNPECATAMILLAEEECSLIVDAEQMYKQAYRVAETALRRSQQMQNHNPAHESMYRRDIHVFVFIRRRLAMCARKLGKLKEAIKMMKDLIKEYPNLNLFNIHENLIECYLAAQQYADAQAFLLKYDDINYPKSATICYTAALLKARQVADKFSPDIASRKGLSAAELSAVEAIHRAVEFNPHVPKYLLEMKSLILPTEHILKRGDSEAIAYAFFHLAHWKAVEGAINLLYCTWEGTFRLIPYPLEKGNLFYPYPHSATATDRELLPSFHDISVYPKKDVPFFILFTAVICSLTAVLACLTHVYPEQMGWLSKKTLHWFFSPMHYLFEKLENMLLALSPGSSRKL
ncbi:Suppression of tumorigenicity [Fasciola hepatica]|uniref:Protein ST7 homolog n=1 Tax=Fasciola hepatica TaxID=6192 RepID=A0A4E0R3B1_FASHE|nr:Suppression of tumorigenicity [Fasciola hepatica]